jgi:prepilin-type N-terminal cleavage/methylation domain-containing protein
MLMKRSPHSFDRAFTMIELLIVIVCLGILAALLLPALAKPKTSAQKINCVNNLKQIGVAFRTWALDYGDKYPAQVSITNGGTMELVLSGSVYPHFSVMSNELSTPKILVCPEDTAREYRIATTFAATVPAGSANTRPFTNDANVSYFVGVDAVDTSPSMFLSGDANVGLDGARPKAGLQPFGPNSNVSWYQPRHEKGKKGNIGLADGSVQVFDSKELRKALAVSGVTNRLAIPASP